MIVASTSYSPDVSLHIELGIKVDPEITNLIG
jgi:hypothetical protein